MAVLCPLSGFVGSLDLAVYSSVFFMQSTCSFTVLSYCNIRKLPEVEELSMSPYKTMRDVL